MENMKEENNDPQNNRTVMTTFFSQKSKLFKSTFLLYFMNFRLRIILRVFIRIGIKVQAERKTKKDILELLRKVKYTECTTILHNTE